MNQHSKSHAAPGLDLWQRILAGYPDGWRDHAKNEAASAWRDLFNEIADAIETAYPR